MEFDLITDYIPEKISDDKVLAAYSRLQAWYALKFPDLDTRPGSVFGDTYVLPAATWMTAVESGMGAFSGDLDLENVANGNITNCAFVEAYLKNFGALDNTNLKSVGILRLVFSTDAALTLNKVMTFTYNDSVYQLRVFGESDLRILPVGYARETPNDYVLTQTSLTRFYVDLPVESYSQGQVLENTRFTSSLPLANNTEIYAVGDFLISSYTSSLPNLAKKTRETFYAASMGSKAGIARTVKREFPDLVSASPAVQGDAEMTRSAANAFGVATPAVDIFVKSPLYGSTVVQVVKAPYVDGVFFTAVEFSYIPLTVTSVRLAGDAEDLPFTLYTKSRDELRYPGLSSSFSKNAKFWLWVSPLAGETIPTALDENGNPYQNFEITYKAEPYADLVTRWLEDPSNTPIGIIPQVRAAVPFVLQSLDVRFKRDRGRKFEFAQARSEISTYLNTISYPVVYTDAEIVDSMFYAGASMTRSIIPFGQLVFSAAQRYVSGDDSEPLDIINNSVELPVVNLGGTGQFNQLHVDESPPEENLFYAASEANTGFVVTEDNINLIET